MAVNNGSSGTMSTREKSSEEQLKDVRKALETASKEELKIKTKQIDTLTEYEKIKAAEVSKTKDQLDKELLDEQIKIAEEAMKKRHKEEKDVQAQLKDQWEEMMGPDNLGKALGSAISSVENTLNGIINNYIDKQISISAHLVGTGYTLGGITDTLQNALSAQGLVSQEKVYENLSKLVQSGIVYNVEQRAFLETLSNDMNLMFNATSGSLTRLIRIQNEDLTANRMAIQYSLQEFLNSNYKTSEYIANAFNNVSDLLLESQSLMSSSGAMRYEASIQSWLGSLYSSGVSQETITGLASAINALGSGDISNIGSGISNLVMMGAAKAGLDYGELLNRGINETTVNSLMKGVSSYINEMGDYNNNVVRSQLANIFGVKISDLMAISNLGATTGGVSTDINSTLFADYSSFVPIGTWVNNLLSNAMYTWGTNIASNPLEYILYKGTMMVGDLLKGVEMSVAPLGIGVNTNLGDITKMAFLLPTLLETIFTDILPSLGAGTSGIAGLYSALAGLSSSSAVIKASGEGVSESAYFGSGSSDDLLSGAKLSSSSYSNQLIEADEEEPLEIIKENVINIYGWLEGTLDRYMNEIIDMMSLTNVAAGAYGAYKELGGV